MARLCAFQSLSSASCCFLRQQPRLSSCALAGLKVSPLPLRSHSSRVVIRGHVEDRNPRELHLMRKKETLKKLRKIRKERRAKRLAEEVAQVQSEVKKPNPALLKFNKPLVNWNKPWRKRSVVVAKPQQMAEPEQDLAAWRGFGGVGDRIQALNSTEEDPSGWSSSVGVREGFEDSEVTDSGNERVNSGLVRNDLRTSVEATDFAREERIGDSKASRREVPRIVIGQRRGKDVYLSMGDDDAVVKKTLPREELDEDHQLEWLVKQLDSLARPDGVHFSRLMRSGGLKITDGRAVTLVKNLGELGNWRCALLVVEWLSSRNQFPVVRSRYLYTTLLSVLGKARRPAESLMVFNVMREHVATYPDVPAYRIVAITLGQAGYMEELIELMQSLRQRPDKKEYLLTANRSCLTPDIVVYNAALNACVPHRHWRLALWILDQIQEEKGVLPNSATYGLTIEVMVKAGKFDLAWKILGKMELWGFHPNALTYKALVESLGQVGKPDVAIKMVKQMEERGIVAVPGVYYALASTLCRCGRWQDALLQVDRTVGGRPLVDTYTGLIKACKESGRWTDAVSVFEHMREVCAPNLGTYNIMISIYGAIKMYDEAKELFDQIKLGRMSPRKLYKSDPRLSPDVFTYDAMLGTCTKSEKWEDLEVLFRQMLLQGYQLDSKRHTWIMRAVSEAGMDDLVAAMFNRLKSLKAPTPELYILMIKSCLRGGEQDQAFSHLQEMVNMGMMISSSDLGNFQKVALLLPEEEGRLSFLEKMESLKRAVEFDFTRKDDPLLKLGRSSDFEPLQTSHSLAKKIRHGSSREASQNRRRTHRSSQEFSSTQENPFCTAVPPVEELALTTNAWQSHGDLKEDIRELESQEDVSQSSSPIVSGTPLVRNDWPSYKDLKEDSRELQSLQDDSQSSSSTASGDLTGWELLWKRSSPLKPNFHRIQL